MIVSVCRKIDVHERNFYAYFNQLQQDANLKPNQISPNNQNFARDIRMYTFNNWHFILTKSASSFPSKATVCG
jgi:hypothetical protein